MRPIDLLFCQLAYWVEVWRAVHGKRVAVVIRRRDGGESQLKPLAKADLKRFGAEVVVLDPGWEEAAWRSYAEGQTLPSEKITVQAELFLVAREWELEGPVLSKRLCVSAGVFCGTSLYGQRIESLHSAERAMCWSVRLVANGVRENAPHDWSKGLRPRSIPFETPRLAVGRPETMGEFIDRFRRMGREADDALSTLDFVLRYVGGEDDDEQTERTTCRDNMRRWVEFVVGELTLDGVVTLEDAISNAAQWAIGGTSDQELYNMRINDGHTALRQLRELVSGLGLYECSQALDPERPLTPSEAMVGAGYAEVKDRQFKLTDFGQAVARSVVEDPRNPENN